MDFFHLHHKKNGESPPAIHKKKWVKKTEGVYNKPKKKKTKKDKYTYTHAKKVPKAPCGGPTIPQASSPAQSSPPPKKRRRGKRAHTSERRASLFKESLLFQKTAPSIHTHKKKRNR